MTNKKEAAQWAAFRNFIAANNSDGVEVGLDVLRACGSRIDESGKKILPPPDCSAKEWKGWQECMMPYIGIIKEGLSVARAV